METKVEFVTSKDLRAWDMLNGTDTKISHEPAKREPREPKPRKEKVIKPEQEHLPTVKEYKTRVASLNMAGATKKALEVVQGNLGYNLSSNGNHVDRFKRIQGWHTFCRCVQLLCPNFTVSGISSTITIDNAPSSETLSHMFKYAKENPHSDKQLKLFLGI